MIKKIFVLLGVILLVSLLVSAGWWYYKYYICTGPSVTYDGQDYDTYLRQCAEEAQSYVEVRCLNNNYCILVDYGIPSGTPRVYVWSFREQKVVASTYTMHGPGNGSTAEKPVFSNIPGSNCSALGHFFVTREHGSRLKRSFRLKGLDISNRNAYARGLMIHRSMWVDAHCWQKYIPLHAKSCQGCMTVSTRGLNYLEKLINSQEKPLLLWSFDSTKQ